MIFQQPNPGVHYQYLLPTEEPVRTQQQGKVTTEVDGFFNDTTNYVYVNKLNKHKQSWVTECHISHVSGNDLNRPGGPEDLGNTEETSNAADDKRAPPSSLPNNKVPMSQPPRRSRDYSWRLAGATECSATCGKGKSHHSSDVFSPRNKSPNSKKVSLKIGWECSK